MWRPGQWAAALGGLGVTARSAPGLPATLVAAARLFDLPPLGTFPISLHVPRDGVSEGVERLRAIIRDEVTTLERRKRRRD